jgi:hypothetical protein
MIPSDRAIPRLFLVGSGPTEIGRGAGNRDSSEGVLPSLLENILAPQTGRFFSNGARAFEVAATERFDKLITLPRQGRRKQLTDRDAEKTVLAMFKAEISGWDGVVILIDRESRSQPDRVARLQAGRHAYRQADQNSGLACAVGAACRSVETWLLADPIARNCVFGSSAPDPFHADPEDRPPPRELKAYIESHAGQLGIEWLDACVKLAIEARPSELRTRCRTSYPPFADEVSAEMGSLI